MIIYVKVLNIFKKNFPELSDFQVDQLNQLQSLYKVWNMKINVVSRKDIDNLDLKHILHSMSILKVIKFKDQTDVLDLGTGGGFPGIPLAIVLPKVNFYLCDSIKKKIKVVDSITNHLELKNVKTIVARAEKLNAKFDFVLSRAVTNLPKFTELVRGRFKENNFNAYKNGIFYLKGGDFINELKQFKNYKIFNIEDYIKEPFFQTKRIVYFPSSCIGRDNP